MEMVDLPCGISVLERKIISPWLGFSCGHPMWHWVCEEGWKKTEVSVGGHFFCLQNKYRKKKPTKDSGPNLRQELGF